jgi:hypothetical protein
MSSLQEKYAMQDMLEDNKLQMADLEIEKQNILQSLKKEENINKELTRVNLLLKRNVKASTHRLSELFTELNTADKSIEDLRTEVSVLKAENTAIRAQGEHLKLDLTRVSKQENDLTERLNSIAELKKAIRELKREKKKRPLIVVEPEKEENTETTELIAEGNRGYLLKDGKSVAVLKVRINVLPASQNAQ